MVVHNNKRVLVAPDSLDKELNAETAAVPTLDHELDLTGEDSAYGAVVVDADSRSVATGVAVIELGDRSFSVDLEEYRDSPWSNVENPIVRDAILAGAVLPVGTDKIRLFGGKKRGGLKRIAKLLKSKEAKVIGNIAKKAAIESVKAAVGVPPAGAGAYTFRQLPTMAAGIRGKGAYRGQGAYRGSGAYNQLFPGLSDSLPMKIASARRDETGNILIHKKEYLFDLFSPATPAAFSCIKFQANPGLPGIGPFVAQIASNYDKYRYRQLIFYYKPVVTDSSSTGQMGVVIMAFQVNAGAPVFSTKQMMAEYDGALSMRVCDEMTLGVECDVSKGADSWLFVRPGAVPSGQDVKTYDFGSLQIATSGVSSASFPAGTQLGEVWAEYTVELAGPKLYDSLGLSIPTDYFYGTTGCTAALPLGTAPLKSSANSLGGTVRKTTQTDYTFPDNFTGWVRIVLMVQGTTLGNISIVTAASVTQFLDLQDPAGTATWNFISNGTGKQIAVFDVFVPLAATSGANLFTLSLASATAISCCQLQVFQWNSLGGNPVSATTNYVAA